MTKNKNSRKSNRSKPAGVLAKAGYKPQQEVVLYGDLHKDIQVPEIKIRYNKGMTFPKTKNSRDVYMFLKKIYGNSISVQEQFVMLLADTSLNILGYYRHTVGTPVSVLTDIPMMLAVALKSMARSVIISHNHTAGTNKPSREDRDITKEFAAAAETVHIKLLDHIIVTKKNGYYSFTDNEGLGGTVEIKKHGNPVKRLRKEISEQLEKVNKNKMLTPMIYDLIQTKNGYKYVEQRIINMMISDGITVSACIPQIESEL